MITVIFLSNLLPKPYILTQPELAALKEKSPAIYYLSGKFNIEEITKSVPFLVMTTFLFMSITVCTMKRTRRFAADMKKVDKIPPAANLNKKIIIPHQSQAVTTSQVRELLNIKRWRSVEEEGETETVLYAGKGKKGFYGSLFFHAGMCVIFAAAFFSSQTRYNGKMILAEGYGIEPPAVLSRMEKKDRANFPVKGMLLESFKPIYDGPFPVDYMANIAYMDADENLRKKTIRVNEPINEDGYQFMLSRRGFAPRFVLKDKDGEVITDDIAILVIFNPEDEDSIELLNGIFTAKISFFPDYFKDDKSAAQGSRSRIPKRPVFSVSISKDGEEVANGMLPVGESMKFSAYTLEAKDLRYWVELDVSKDSGMPFIFASFIMIVAGLSIRLMLNEKSLWFIIDEKNVSIGGKTAYFPALFEEEIDRFADDIRDKIKAPVTI